jgi:uncharacterized protein (TIGR02246 family)
VSENPHQIASDFIGRWERTWNEQGAHAVAQLYTPDAILVGYVVVEGREQIARLLQGIVEQGWTRIQIKVVGVRQLGAVILIATEYTASGPEENTGKRLDAKSSHVLTRVGDEWLSAMHTAA